MLLLACEGEYCSLMFYKDKDFEANFDGEKWTVK